MSCNNNFKLGFSLPELMVLLLALSIMLAAAAPVVSKRKPSATATALPRGAIIVWCKPGGIPDGFKVCDAANHGDHPEIPVLTNRFVIGAVNNAASPYRFRDPQADPVGDTEQLGTSCTSLTDCTHAFSLAELPPHNHGNTCTLTSDAFTHTHSIELSLVGNHTHADTNSSVPTGAHYHTLASSLLASTGLGINYFLTGTSNSTIYPFYYSKRFSLTNITTAAGSAHDHGTVNTVGTHDHGGTIASTNGGNHNHAYTVSTAGVDTDTHATPPTPYSFNFLYQHRNCYYIIRNLDASWD